MRYDRQSLSERYAKRRYRRRRRSPSPSFNTVIYPEDREPKQKHINRKKLVIFILFLTALALVSSGAIAIRDWLDTPAKSLMLIAGLMAGTVWVIGKIS